VSFSFVLSQDAAVQDVIARLEKRRGVEGVLVASRDGRVIKSTVPDSLAPTYAALLTNLVETARTCTKDMDEKARPRAFALSLGQGGTFVPNGGRCTSVMCGLLQDELAFLRVRTKKHDIMLTPSTCRTARTC